MKGAHIISEWVGDGKDFPMDQQIAMSDKWHDEVAMGIALDVSKDPVEVGPLNLAGKSPAEIDVVRVGMLGSLLRYKRVKGEEPVPLFELVVVGDDVTFRIPREHLLTPEAQKTLRLIEKGKKLRAWLEEEVVKLDGGDLAKKYIARIAGLAIMPPALEATVDLDDYSASGPYEQEADVRHVYPKTNPDDIKPITDYPDTGPQSPLASDWFPCYHEDVTGQHVRLDRGSPSPNLAVFLVVELRSPKHAGRVAGIKDDPRFCVLEEWEVPADGELQIAVQTVSDEDVGDFLQAKGVAKAVRDLVKGDHRVSRVRKLFKDFEKKPVVVEG